MLLLQLLLRAAQTPALAAVLCLAWPSPLLLLLWPTDWQSVAQRLPCGCILHRSAAGVGVLIFVIACEIHWIPQPVAALACAKVLKSHLQLGLAASLQGALSLVRRRLDLIVHYWLRGGSWFRWLLQQGALVQVQ